MQKDFCFSLPLGLGRLVSQLCPYSRMHKIIQHAKCCYPGTGGFTSVAVGLSGSGCVFVTAFYGKGHTVEKNLCIAQSGSKERKRKNRMEWYIPVILAQVGRQ